MTTAKTLRDHVTDDHARGCWGRQYSCSCGYDLKTEGLLEIAADRIEQLEAALREAEQFIAYFANETDGVFVGSGTPTTCLVTIRAALDQSSPIPEKPGVNAV